ncbi:MAG: hypothetical protein JWR19_3519 [Pedosphaera sp.]|nr:hypothetical protein [Pedosphaera sp.]
MTTCIILQNRKSSLYLKSVSEWTPDDQKAAKFERMTEALDFLRTVKVEKDSIDMVLIWGDRRYDLRVSI